MGPDDDRAVRVRALRIGEDELVVIRVPLPAADLSALPRAQRETAELLLAGLGNAEIARRRGRSERTVANQVAAIFRRFGVSSRAELVAKLG